VIVQLPVEPPGPHQLEKGLGHGGRRDRGSEEVGHPEKCAADERASCGNTQIDAAKDKQTASVVDPGDPRLGPDTRSFARDDAHGKSEQRKKEDRPERGPADRT
jgi:hypothetical protein